MRTMLGKAITGGLILTASFVPASTATAASTPGLSGPLPGVEAADPWRPCEPAGSTWAPNDKDPSPWGTYFLHNATKLRETASTSAVACAEGQTSHTVDLHCFIIVNHVGWNYVRDVTTGGWAGWVPDSDLKVVSGVPC